jgi:cytochrome c-type biogenesis protein CcmF
MARWKEAALPDMAVRLKWAAGVSVLAALAASWAAGEVKFGASLALGAGFWVLASTVADIVEHVRVPGAGLFSRLAWQRLRQQPRAVVGMWTAHAGVAVFIFGVTMVSAWQVERDVTLAPGQSVEVQGLSFTFRGVAEREGPNFDAVRGTIEVAREGKVFTTLRPEKRVYRVQKNPMTEASIRTRLSGDIYVSLGEPTTQQLDGPWIVRIYLKPFVAWIWGGCVVMALGGLLAASDRRYRAKLARRDVPAGGAVAT